MMFSITIQATFVSHTYSMYYNRDMLASQCVDIALMKFRYIAQL